MKVHELIAILSQKDPNANVYVMMQQKWPFECGLAGVAVREDFTATFDGEGESDPGANAEKGNDVFLLEGSQIRYGSRQAWDVAQTAP